MKPLLHALTLTAALALPASAQTPLSPNRSPPQASNGPAWVEPPPSDHRPSPAAPPKAAIEEPAAKGDDSAAAPEPPQAETKRSARTEHRSRRSRRAAARSRDTMASALNRRERYGGIRAVSRPYAQWYYPPSSPMSGP